MVFFKLKTKTEYRNIFISIRIMKASYNQYYFIDLNTFDTKEKQKWKDLPTSEVNQIIDTTSGDEIICDTYLLILKSIKRVTSKVWACSGLYYETRTLEGPFIRSTTAYTLIRQKTA